MRRRLLSAAMLVDVLGCDGTYPGPGSATAGFLVRSGDTVLWMDAGVGTLAELTKRVPLQELDAIAVSHSHIDHCADLAIYHHAASYGPERLEPIALFAAEGVLDRIAAFNSGTVESFDHRIVGNGDTTEVGDLAIAFGPANHSTDAVSIRVTNAAGSMVYTGDTGWDDRLVEFARGAEVLLSEATLVGLATGVNGHQSPTEAGRLAHRAGVGRLVLVHIPPHLDRTVAVAEAASEFDGPVEAARPGMTIEIGTT